MTCDLCKGPIDGPPFGPKWSDQWCMSCWFTVTDQGSALLNACVTALKGTGLDVRSADPDELLAALKDHEEDVDCDLDTARQDLDAAEEKVEDLERQLGQIEKAREALEQIKATRRISALIAAWPPPSALSRAEWRPPKRGNRRVRLGPAARRAGPFLSGREKARHGALAGIVTPASTGAAGG